MISINRNYSKASESLLIRYFYLSKIEFSFIFANFTSILSRTQRIEEINTRDKYTLFNQTRNEKDFNSTHIDCLS